MTSSVEMHTSSIQTVTSKYHFPLKGIRAPWRNGQFQILGLETFMMSLDHLLTQVSTEVSKTTWVVPKSLKSLPMAKDGKICISIKIINAVF